MRPLSLAVLLMSTGCSTTYKNVAKLETNWLGQVSEVEGGTATANGPGWMGGLSDLTGNLTWFLVVGGLLFLVLCWKFPGWLRTIKANRAARAALSRRSQP